jgi:hypothetical protein
VAATRAPRLYPPSTTDVRGPPAPAKAGDQAAAAARWDLQSSGEGTALVLMSAAGGTDFRFFARPGVNRLLVNVPDFRPIGSEERLSFGSGGEVAALVADPRGDRQRGGVSGYRRRPGQPRRSGRRPVSASYGAQTAGRTRRLHRTCPAPLSALAARTTETRTQRPPGPQTPPSETAGAGPCLCRTAPASM